MKVMFFIVLGVLIEWWLPYKVKPGDTLWKIAKQYYGDGSLYPDIFKANQDILSDPDKIKVGQKLRIP